MKLIEYNSIDPYFNLAAEEYYFTRREGDIFRLWQNDNTIVIGKNQNPYNEIDLNVVRENGVKVSRRMTGGGAVYHDLGNVNFSFITRAEKGGFDFAAFNAPIIKALRSFGVEAETKGRNDITVEGKKISGSAQYISGERLLHHGTLLFGSDLEFIGKCLTASGDKLKSKGVASVRARVANICDFMHNPVSVGEFMDMLRGFLTAEFSGCRNSAPSDEDLAGINALKEKKYGTWDWIYGSSPQYGYVTEKRFEGCGSISVHLDIKGGLIAGCRIFGDFFGSGEVRDIEKRLSGVRARREDLREALAGVEINRYFHNLTPEGFLGMFEF